MPSPAANRLAAEHRRRLNQVASRIARRVNTVTSTADAADIDRWWDAQSADLERIVTRGARATSTLASRYLRSRSLVEGVSVTPVPTVPTLTQVAQALLLAGPVAFKTTIARTGSEAAALQSLRGRLEGTANKLTLSGDRMSTMNTFATNETIVGYRRVATGPDPCAWCLALVSRGSVYTEFSARRVVGEGGRPRGNRQIGELFHDSCHCVVDITYEREPDPPEVVELRQRWDEATAGLTGREALAAFRRATGAR